MVKRVSKSEDGKYHIHGKKYEQLVGSRAQVYHQTAYKTAGDLKKSDIMMNKNGRIVSVKKHNTAKREKRLVKAGYITKKGKFGFIKMSKSKKRGGNLFSAVGDAAESLGETAGTLGNKMKNFASSSGIKPMARTGGRRHSRRNRRTRKGGDIA